MEEGHALSLRPQARDLIHQDDARVAATREGAVEVVDGKAQVMDAGAALVDELGDRGSGLGGLEEFDQRAAGGKARDPGAVGIGEGDLREPEEVLEEGPEGRGRLHGEPDVGDAGTAAGIGWHDGGVRLGRGTRGAAREHYAIGRARATHRAAGDEKTMSNAVAVTDADFEAQVEKQPGLTVVDFWATWCGPCRMVAPILDQLASEYEGKVRVAKLDVDSNQKTTMRFNVRSIPAMLFFKDGKLVDQVIGAVPKSALAAKFAQHAA